MLIFLSTQHFYISLFPRARAQDCQLCFNYEIGRAFSENTNLTPPGPPPPTPLIFAKTSTAPKLGISHLMIPLMEALGVSSLGKIGFISYGRLKTADSYT